MRLISTRSLEPGMILASAVYNQVGQVLLQEKVELKISLIKRLIELDIKYVYIEDSLSAGIKVKDTIPASVKHKAIQTVEAAFTDMQAENKSKRSFLLDQNSKIFKDIIKGLLDEIKGNRDLLTILTDVYIYDSYIFQHSFNVTLYTLAVAMEMGYSSKSLETIGLGAILHDVGKMMVPEDILMKPGKLTGDEFEVVKKHTDFGFDILRQLHTVPLLVAHCAFQHHERLDGSGYPRGLNGKEMHEYAKIIAVADVFDAVTSNRVYRGALLPHEGLEVLYAGSGTLFEPEIVDAFRRSVTIYPNGITVLLNDSRKGIVSKQNPSLTERPVIRIIEENGRELQEPYEIDLKIELDVMIHSCDVDWKSPVAK
ncbi:HD-GYP domain-containing protein [Falsibacillus pallidus]|uniref:Putative nucleotidyltransferase with HDIG domain n=1 Tax=Falsibacillus pallidus TaxID=493781 RepID=A0A370GEC4_9BACI|nr:HD-GYP domain-containing protein [Falsibacillus pallidus]RDI41449.1 putative nucleotidyltransferase with HDIG domain [Falsibacillus pallidus]